MSLYIIYILSTYLSHMYKELLKFDKKDNPTEIWAKMLKLTRSQGNANYSNNQIWFYISMIGKGKSLYYPLFVEIWIKDI